MTEAQDEIQSKYGQEIPTDGIPEEFLNFTKDEQNQLLFLHFGAVNWGKIAGCQMNSYDFAITEKFEEQGLCRFRRIKTTEPEFPGGNNGFPSTSQKTHLVMLTNLGFKVANYYHQKRQQRWLLEKGYTPAEREQRRAEENR